MRTGYGCSAQRAGSRCSAQPTLKGVMLAKLQGRRQVSSSNSTCTSEAAIGI